MINKSQLIKGLFKPQTRDYTYGIIFFLVFAFFIVFAIKPSLSTAFSIKQKLEELKIVDKAYEEEIKKVIELQSNLEKIRDDLYLYSEAVPNSVKINKVIDDIKQTLDKNNLSLNNMNIGEVSLKENINEKKINIIGINLETNGTFKNSLNFIQDIRSQRRLKSIKSLSIDPDNNTSSASGNVILRFNFESYYL